MHDGEIAGFWQFARSHPDRVALVDQDGTSLTFGAAVDQVDRISRAFQRRGLVPGSNIAILARNRSQYLLVVLAAYQIGCYYTAINSHLSEPEVEYILRDCEPSIVVLDADTYDLGSNAAKLASLPQDRILSFDGIHIDGDDLSTITTLAAIEASGPPPRRCAGAPMLYTSGTSGRPKGVRPRASAALRTPEEGLTARLVPLLARFDIDGVENVGRGVHLVTSPIYHSAPLNAALTALYLGHTVIVMRKFDAEESLRLVERHSVTWSQVVPTMMKRWLDLGPEALRAVDVGSLRWLIHAGAPCPVDIKMRMMQWLGPILYEYYASTEGGGTVIGPHDWLDHRGSVGRPWPGADIVILDDDGRPITNGDIGQIYMKNLRPFSYHGDEAKTDDAVKDGYLTVGDLGRLDADGFLYIADRRTDLVISGGVNIYPAEIESVLLGHPDVVDAAVIGIPDDELHQVVHAVVQPRLDTNELVLDGELRALCTRELGSQKRPRTIEFRAQLPRTETGKLLRRKLQEDYGPQVGDSPNRALVHKTCEHTAAGGAS